MIGTRWFQPLLAPLIVVLVLVATFAVFQVPIAAGLNLLFEGALGDRFGVSRSFVKSTPLLLTGLGMVVAWRAGAYNIGGEGQFVIGGLFGAILFKAFASGPPSTALPFQVGALAVSAVGGAAWAALAGLAFSKRSVPIVISTILLNFIALQLLSWAAESPLREVTGRLPLTDLVPDHLMLPRFNRQADAHVGILLALIAVPAVYLLLQRTALGFRLKLVGANPLAARTARVDVPRTQVLALAISGSLCGLAGGIEYLAVSGQVGTTFSQGWGFLGIPVALLGGLQPLFVALSALLFGVLFAGTEHVGRFIPGGQTMIFVAQGAAVLAMLALSKVKVPAKVAHDG